MTQSNQEPCREGCPFCGAGPVETANGWAVHHIAGCFLSLSGVGSIYISYGLTKQWNARTPPTDTAQEITASLDESSDKNHRSDSVPGITQVAESEGPRTLNSTSRESLGNSCESGDTEIDKLKAQVRMLRGALKRLSSPESLSGISRPATDEEISRMKYAQDTLDTLEKGTR